MNNTGAVVKADNSGQKDSSSNTTEDYYEIKITKDEPEVTITCDMNPKRMCHVVVNIGGFYCVRIYAKKENIDFSGSTIALYLKSWGKKNKQEDVSLQSFKETTYNRLDDELETFHYILVGDIETNDVVIHQRYRAIMHLKAKKDYYLEYSISQTVSEFELTFSANRDQYQYDSINDKAKDWESGEKGIVESETGITVGKGIITPMLTTAKMKELYKLVPDDIMEPGINCITMWTHSNDSSEEFAGDLKRTLFIEYVDQRIGTWLYKIFKDILDKINDLTSEQKKNKAFWLGVLETVGATAAGSVVGGIIGISASAGGVAGFVLTVAFLLGHKFEDTQSILDTICSKMGKYYDDVNECLKNPIRLDAFVEYKDAFDVIGEAAIEFYSWDGTVVGALGQEYRWGTFDYTIYPETVLVHARKQCMDLIEQLFS